MLDRGLIEALELQGRYNQIEPFLYKFPAIDPPSFRRAVAEALEV
jgi:hypothetical protein